MPDHMWTYLISQIHQQRLTPIISNKLSNNYLLGGRNAAEVWLEAIEFPFTNSPRLARIAQYLSVIMKDENVAKVEYLEFLKNELYNSAQAEPKADQSALFLATLEKELPYITVSEVASRLGYPIFENEPSDSLCILAQLPLSIYLTTSYHQLIEMALAAVGKKAQTRVYPWRRSELNRSPLFRPELEAEPSNDQPLVYHVFGIDSVSDSLVLTEDNYFDFLSTMHEDLDKPGIIPSPVRMALASSSLLLLGYDLFAWDFRTVFRSVIRSLHTFRRPLSLVIQLDPGAGVGIQNKQAVQEYLGTYFRDYKFDIYWNDVQEFTQDLWKHWER